MELNINSPAYFTNVYGIDDEVYKYCQTLHVFFREKEYSDRALFELYFSSLPLRFKLTNLRFNLSPEQKVQLILRIFLFVQYPIDHFTNR